MLRPLLLNGFMGTGKSTVGRLVAERTQRPFVDLDRSIEERAGLSVERLFAERGEPAFRSLERAALGELLDRSGSGTAPVVALGGGALLARELRLRALDEAVVVTLESEPAELARRLSGSHVRPLLAGADPLARIQELLGLRAGAYAEAHARVPSTGEPSRIAERVLAVWQRDPLAVAAGESSYAVEVGSGIAGARVADLASSAPVVMRVSDRTVAALHAEAFDRALSDARSSLLRVELEPGEEHKRTDSVEAIWRAALQGGADRKSVFVALGGGVVSDITGFAAATFMRGVRWCSVPTTLLAMVDASVGGKTGIDLDAAKNAVGAFWQPCGVLCDVAHLETESQRGFVSALAEVVKTALIGDPDLFTLLERHPDAVLARDSSLVMEIVRRSIRVKARIVSSDERETGLRAVLNLGHTVGHALEAYAGYSRLSHGEAVSLGLVAALQVGQRLGKTPHELGERVGALLRRLGLPADLGREPVADAARLIGHDKKRRGASLRFVVARELGRVETTEVGLSDLVEHVRALAN